jgi:hypothetical protein
VEKPIWVVAWESSETQAKGNTVQIRIRGYVARPLFPSPNVWERAGVRVRAQADHYCPSAYYLSPGPFPRGGRGDETPTLRLSERCWRLNLAELALDGALFLWLSLSTIGAPVGAGRGLRRVDCLADLLQGRAQLLGRRANRL